MDILDEEIRAVDPFGFWPTKPSALIDREGTDGTDPGEYVFHTPYALHAEGAFEFRGRFADLEGDGELILRVNELGPERGGAAVSISTDVFRLAYLLGTGGEFKVTVNARAGCRYALVGSISPGTRCRASLPLLTVSGQIGAAQYRRQLIEAREAIFARPPVFQGLYGIVEGEPSLEHPISQACTVGQFREPAYTRWIDALKRPMHWHRKQWEFVYILQALDYYGALEPGSRGLGFGVGEEPLPALMASMGCTVTATDLPADDERVDAWSGTGQHSRNLKGLSQPDIIDDQELALKVEFAPVDMTSIPVDLVDYDFTWSSCALEHVGSIVSGLDFIESSIGCLRPGGIAVHTTELNLLSDDETIDHEGTVLFRRRDFEEIAARLVLRGHDVMPLNFSSGNSPLDDHIDMPPYSSNNHFKLVMSQYLTTSFGIIVRRGAGDI